MLKIHSLPEGEKKSALFGVCVNGIPVVPEFARVSAMPFNTPWPGHQRDLAQTEEAAFISFEGDESAVLDVECSVNVEKAVVRPLSKNVNIEILSERKVRFTLTQVGNYVLEINGIHNPLTIFYNPVRDFAAEAKQDAENGRTVHYFGKGVHNVGHMVIGSNTTVTVDAGAIVYGSFSAFSANDVKINGYGVIDGSFEIRTSNTLLIPVMHKFKNEYPYFADNKELFDKFMQETATLIGNLRFYFCENVSCEGVILRDSSTFCVVPAICKNVVIDNIKTIGMWRYNSDGIDIFNSCDVVVKNCFLRNFDDAMVIKGIAGWDYQNNENITIDNCVIWCDWGAACEIGAETNAHEYKNILYKNCDLIHDMGGAMMRIHHHNRADVHHVHYENIHCEFVSDQMNAVFQSSDDQVYDYKPGSQQPQIINLVIPKTIVYGRDSIKGCIHDISFKDIYLHFEEGMEIIPPIYINGLSQKAYIENVTLENFYVNGKKVDIATELKPRVNEYAHNIQF